MNGSAPKCNANKTLPFVIKYGKLTKILDSLCWLTLALQDIENVEYPCYSVHVTKNPAHVWSNNRVYPGLPPPPPLPPPQPSSSSSSSFPHPPSPPPLLSSFFLLYFFFTHGPEFASQLRNILKLWWWKTEVKDCGLQGVMLCSGVEWSRHFVMSGSFNSTM